MQKNKVSDNLTKILTYRQLKPSELARLADLPPTTINKYLKRQSIPGLDKAYAIARALNVPLEALMTGHVDETSISFQPVPLLAEMPTSPPPEAAESGRRTVPIPTDRLPDDEGVYFACKVRDESMVMAGLMPGATAVIWYRPVLDNGDIAAVVSRGESFLRYIIFYPNTIVLQPANPVYQPTLIPRADAAALQVIGKVILAITSY
jgi:SOS-response transcriptional repressor LexA